MRNLLRFLFFSLTPAAFIGGFLWVLFTHMGYGVDWPFITLASGLTLVMGTATAVVDLLERWEDEARRAEWRLADIKARIDYFVPSEPRATNDSQRVGPNPFI